MRLYEFITESINVDENLKKWFKDKWVRFGPDGKIRGDCARGSSGEGKPKCLPKSKAQALGKKGRASSAAKKRREDPNPERSGAAKNVATKVKEAQLDEKCWKGYRKDGMKTMFGKKYPNCVKKKKTNEEIESAVFETLQQRLGSDEIRRIQQMLNVKYNANLDIDGELGPLTIKSIKEFLPKANQGPAPTPEKTTAVQGNQTKLDEKCWDTHKQVGMKSKGGRMVPNCVPKESISEGIPFDQCPCCGGKIVHESQLNEKQDACYHKVKSRYKVWPSAYASGALVQCRKKGAANWGNKSTKESIEENFADGKNPQDKGDSARHGIPKGATMAQLEKAAKAPGRKGQLARWQINMRRGKKK